MKLLFVNACVRKESRTLGLCRTLLDRMPEGWQLQEVDLSREPPAFLTEDGIARRNAALAAGDFSGDAFALARDFAQADRILIGAPYWDLSFPACLKAYLENICVVGIAFRYDQTGMPVPMCRAKKMVYVSTCGGYVGEFDSGEQYLGGLCRLLGIPDFRAFYAEGLDIQGNDVEAILQKTALALGSAPIYE